MGSVREPPVGSVAHGWAWARPDDRFVVLLLKVPPIRTAFARVNDAVDAVASATRAGTSFVFGYLGGGPLPFELKTPGP